MPKNPTLNPGFQISNTTIINVLNATKPYLSLFNSQSWKIFVVKNKRKIGKEVFKKYCLAVYKEYEIKEIR